MVGRKYVSDTSGNRSRDRTVRLVAQRLNHYATPGPYSYSLHTLIRIELKFVTKVHEFLYNTLVDKLYYHKTEILRILDKSISNNVIGIKHLYTFLHKAKEKMEKMKQRKRCDV